MKYDFDTQEDRNLFCTNEFGGAKEHRLIQLGDLDLVFKGWRISHCGDSTQYEDADKSSVEVRLYITERGSHVAEIIRNFPDFRAGGKRVTKSKSSAFASYLEMLEWLREDGKGWLGTNSKIAWEEMCSRLPWLHSADTIRA